MPAVTCLGSRLRATSAGMTEWVCERSPPLNVIAAQNRPALRRGDVGAALLALRGTGIAGALSGARRAGGAHETPEVNQSLSPNALR